MSVRFFDTSRHPATEWGFLRIEAGADDHSAEVPKAVLSPHDEQGLVEVRVVLPQLLLLDFPVETQGIRLEINRSICDM